MNSRARTLVARPQRRLLTATVALIAALVLALGTGVAEAKPGNGKGGNGGNGGGNGRGNVSVVDGTTLTASPNPVQAGGAPFTLEGCGYDTSTPVDFLVRTEQYIWFWSVGVDASGCISSQQRSDFAGTYEIETYQDLKGKKPTLMATTELLVVE